MSSKSKAAQPATSAGHSSKGCAEGGDDIGVGGKEFVLFPAAVKT